MAAEVELELDGDVACILLNRPHRLNAVNPALADALVQTLRQVGELDVAAVILGGRGRAFCAGHDLKEPPGAAATARHRLDRIQEVTRLIRALPQPVIAAVQGFAVGAGAEFALGCDLVLAAEDVSISFPEVAVGLSVTGGISRLLPLLVGPLRAKELILRGEPITGAEALRMGLVNRLVPPGDLMVTARQWAHGLAGQPRAATTLAKRALDAGIDSSLAAAFELEVANALITDGSPDVRRAAAAFSGRDARAGLTGRS